MKLFIPAVALVLSACVSAPVAKSDPPRTIAAVAAVDESHYPKTLTPEEEAKLPLASLEELYLKERCKEKNCADILQREADPKDILSIAEQTVLQKYTESYLIENERIMEAAAEKLPSQTIVAYRGGSSRFYGALKKDEVIELTRLSSISSDRNKAEDFIKDELWKVHVTSAKDIQPYSVAPEHEYLLLPGTHLKVLKVGTTKVDFSAGDVKKKPVSIPLIELIEVKN